MPRKLKIAFFNNREPLVPKQVQKKKKTDSRQPTTDNNAQTSLLRTAARCRPNATSPRCCAPANPPTNRNNWRRSTANREKSARTQTHTQTHATPRQIVKTRAQRMAMRSAATLLSDRSISLHCFRWCFNAAQTSLSAAPSMRLRDSSSALKCSCARKRPHSEATLLASIDLSDRSSRTRPDGRR